MSARFLADHPAWRATVEGERARLVEHDGSAWLAIWNQAREHIGLWPIAGDPAAPPPPVAHTSPIGLPVGPEEALPLLAELIRLGTVGRLTNTSLWDAVVAAVLRRGVAVRRARYTYYTFCTAYGRSFATGVGDFSLTPDPGTVLALSDGQFAAVGATSGRPALRAAATAYLDRGGYWATLAPESLVKELGQVHRLGSWAAAVAAADFTGDFSVYPYGDAAVRAQAARAAPRIGFPDEAAEFKKLWCRWAATRVQLHTLTLFTLARGMGPVADRGASGTAHSAPRYRPPRLGPPVVTLSCAPRCRPRMRRGSRAWRPRAPSPYAASVARRRSAVRRRATRPRSSARCPESAAWPPAPWRSAPRT
ncbi:hypothetical protein [Streptomyces sp. CC208A]|uniref:hypothetical protein n=1 Tax=Streptomyces sp. CC208A TaxID=3044573 RepID=UPI0024A979D2|nr:hypothetical protein [Streptomyces sp. CC208A]